MTEGEGEEVQQVRAAIAALFEKGSPEDRFVGLSHLLNDWPQLHRAVRELRQSAATELYQGGEHSYSSMGALIGVTPSRARHIAKGIVRPVRDNAKAAKADAADEAPRE